jgi:DNA polymerase-3 subunit alpha
VASIDLAFEFAATTLANAHQGGLFDLFDAGEGHGSSTQEPALVDATPWGVKEQLTLEKTAIGFYLSGHLFDEVASEVRRFIRRPMDELRESREPQLVAGIVSDLRIINAQRGKLAIFKLDDKSVTLEATADEALINAHRQLLQDDAFIVALGKLQTDRFSGGLRLSITQMWDLNGARCRFGRYLRVAFKGQADEVRALVAEFPAHVEHAPEGDLVRGLPMRLVLQRHTPALSVQAELQLGDSARVFPTDAALAAWRARAEEGLATVVYESA